MQDYNDNKPDIAWLKHNARLDAEKEVKDDIEQLQALTKEFSEYIVEENKIYRFKKHYCCECGDLWDEHNNDRCKVLKAQQYLDSLTN